MALTAATHMHRPYPSPPPAPSGLCEPGREVNVLSGECVNCAPGKYNDAEGGTCQDCTAGYYCPAVPPFGAIKPVPCPGGTYSTATDLTLASGCAASPQGFYAPLGTTAPVECPDNMDCPASSAFPPGLCGPFMRHHVLNGRCRAYR